MTEKWKTQFKLFSLVGFLGFTGFLTLAVLAQSATVQDIDQLTEQSTPIIPDQVEDEPLNEVQERGIPQKQPSGGLPLNQVVPMGQKFRGKKPGAMGSAVDVSTAAVVTTISNHELNRMKGVLQGVDKDLNSPKKQQSPMNQAH